MVHAQGLKAIPILTRPECQLLTNKLKIKGRPVRVFLEKLIPVLYNSGRYPPIGDESLPGNGKLIFTFKRWERTRDVFFPSNETPIVSAKQM